MAILTNGLNDGFTGKLGNTVTYMLNGKMVRRTIGKRLTAPSILELANRQKITLITAFLYPIKSFIQTGFEFEAKRELKSAHNIATFYLRLNAIAGTYPDQHIDYSKALLSKGKMPLVSNAQARRIENGFEFTWDTAILPVGVKETDQVMLMVYIPERKVGRYLINAGKRVDASAQLIIPVSTIPLMVETYISFISEDHKSISDSFYTGRFIW